MSTPEDPWEIVDSGDALSDRDWAMKRGLCATGHAQTDDWPSWARYVYFSVETKDEVRAIRLLAEGGDAERAAVESAHALGGYEAVKGYVAGLLAAAQEEVAGGLNRPEETA